jgi:hypothetical protein
MANSSSLVVAWPDVQSKAAELMSRGDIGEPLKLFGDSED